MVLSFFVPGLVPARPPSLLSSFPSLKRGENEDGGVEK